MPNVCGTVYPDPANPGEFVSVVTSSADDTVVTLAVVSESAGEDQAWVDIETALGYDPFAVPLGPENTSQT